MIAICPLVGCGPDPSAPTSVGSGGGNAAGGNPGAGGAQPAGGGANTTPGGAGSTSFSGSGPGGSGTSGSGAGGPSAGGAGAGGSAVGGGGQSGAHATGGTGTAGASAVVDPNSPETPIGNVTAYPLGSFSIAGSIYFLAHDAGGLYAMTMACTHAGCACDMKGTQLTCPCHGSVFDHLGNVLKGPATKPLPHFPVFVDATGNITVDRFTVVSQSTRTPV